MIVHNKKTLQLDKRARIKLRTGGRHRVKIRRVMLAAMMIAALAMPMVASAITVDLPYQQTFKNNSAENSVADTFDYQLTAADAASPMPAGSSGGVYRFSLKGNTSGSLKLDISYPKPGYYYYTVRSKVDSPKKGYTYNKKVYTVMVMVVNGPNGLEVGAITIQDANQNKYGKLIFKTKYYKKRPGGGSGGSGSNAGGGTTGGETPPEIPLDDLDGIEDGTDDQFAGIEKPEAPIAGVEDEDYWALVNLICMLLTWITAIVAGILYIRRRRQASGDQDAEADELEDPQKLKRKGWLRIAAVAAAIISLILFIFTEDMTLPMELVDEWTIWMIVILAAALLLALISRKVTEDTESTPEG